MIGVGAGEGSVTVMEIVNPTVSVGSTSVATHVACNCSCVFIRDLIVLCSTILNYIYHLCVLEVVASGIDDIIVQTVSVDVAVEDETPNVVMEVIVVSTSVDASVLLIAVAQASFHMIVLEGQEA
jgi:hypothetical protein